MLPLESLEVVVQLLVPRVQHTHLEAERRAGDNKVGDGESAGDDHVDCWRIDLCCFAVVVVVEVKVIDSLDTQGETVERCE